MEKEPEVWADIIGYEGLYQVSTWGRVYSLPKKGRGGHNGKYLSPGSDNYGYLLLALLKNKKRKTLRVHCLVAQAFIPNPNNYPHVMHLDDNPTNNY